MQSRPHFPQHKSMWKKNPWNSQHKITKNPTQFEVVEVVESIPANLYILSTLINNS